MHACYCTLTYSYRQIRLFSIKAEKLLAVYKLLLAMWRLQFLLALLVAFSGTSDGSNMNAGSLTGDNANIETRYFRRGGILKRRADKHNYFKWNCDVK